MKPLKLIFISNTGNTRNFAENLVNYAQEQNQKNPDYPLLSIEEISEQTDFGNENEPYFVSVPTYLSGGDGTGDNVKEVMTNILGEYLDYHDNAKQCLGIIGSGNKNFNIQYCLTAKRYSKRFNVPFLADFELRGNDKDVQRIYEDMVERTKEVNQ
ncbi:class Ib ribonucleoside-diphosphate reductase assembly flavoprotein NrdI [Fructilactobacillus sanfranciscensis]|uniref:class Ib ribonucleoside-diphosphate reductase assembly flavoprotein NrdI n=1 Tax=Fructilactobacillus sanfranciscensis TaxID=1625 RepID=UPI001119433C|nr:class Ib ribonucleoside-diphosphate reductase assembly flavoprotein NrdI [Fructilactobacillus sanfranciscensis]TNK96849.1 ribonucleotide reductase assembly protein NrdI [Fructilactobacillus sanfranciscensis]TNK99054.1 ribonucleotide reductase assembly protein NrdI [Fructilactobacillus sanfranciscensis]